MISEILLESIVKNSPEITAGKLAKIVDSKVDAIYARLRYAVNIYEGNNGKLYFYEWKKRGQKL